jgi:hypothetical protein
MPNWPEPPKAGTPNKNGVEMHPLGAEAVAFSLDDVGSEAQSASWNPKKTVILTKQHL